MGEINLHSMEKFTGQLAPETHRVPSTSNYKKTKLKGLIFYGNVWKISEMEDWEEN